MAGHLQRLLNFHSTGGVVTWLPLFVFTVSAVPPRRVKSPNERRPRSTAGGATARDPTLKLALAHATAIVVRRPKRASAAWLLLRIESLQQRGAVRATRTRALWRRALLQPWPARAPPPRVAKRRARRDSPRYACGTGRPACASAWLVRGPRSPGQGRRRDPFDQSQSDFSPSAAKPLLDRPAIGRPSSDSLGPVCWVKGSDVGFRQLAARNPARRGGYPHRAGSRLVRRPKGRRRRSRAHPRFRDIAFSC